MFSKKHPPPSLSYIPKPPKIGSATKCFLQYFISFVYINMSEQWILILACTYLSCTDEFKFSSKQVILRINKIIIQKFLKFIDYLIKYDYIIESIFFFLIIIIPIIWNIKCAYIFKLEANLPSLACFHFNSCKLSQNICSTPEFQDNLLNSTKLSQSSNP